MIAHIFLFSFSFKCLLCKDTLYASTLYSMCNTCNTFVNILKIAFYFLFTAHKLILNDVITLYRNNDDLVNIPQQFCLRFILLFRIYHLIWILFCFVCFVFCILKIILFAFVYLYYKAIVFGIAVQYTLEHASKFTIVKKSNSTQYFPLSLYLLSFICLFFCVL